jgi:hypothetical protein
MHERRILRRAGGYGMKRMTFAGKCRVLSLVLLLMGLSFVFMFSTMLNFGGEAIARDDQRSGTEDSKWDVLHRNGRTVGAVDADGNNYSRNGRKIGTVDDDGTVFNVSETAVGKVDP